MSEVFIASNESAVKIKTRLFLSPSLISTSWFLNLAKVFRNGHVVACSTARHSATAKKERYGYVSAPCWAKLTQLNRAVKCKKF